MSKTLVCLFTAHALYLTSQSLEKLSGHKTAKSLLVDRATFFLTIHFYEDNKFMLHKLKRKFLFEFFPLS